MNVLTALTEEEWSSMTAMAAVVHLKKDELIFRKGERNDKEVFVSSGIVRGFITDEGGNERSTAFFQAGEFMSTHTLRTQQNVSIYNYQALCAVTVLLFDSKQLKQFLSETKKLTALGKEIKERELTRIVHRDECLVHVKAADKYQKFLTFHPNLERQVSQRYIASYLGITPVSLSRLKKSMIA